MRSLQEKEKDMTTAIKNKDQKIDELFRQVRTLKTYSRELKFLAQDLSPPGQPLDPILTQPPPVDLDEEMAQDLTAQRAASEMSRLRLRNQDLTRQLEDVVNRSQYGKDVQTSAIMKSVHGSEQDRNENALAGLQQENNVLRA